MHDMLVGRILRLRSFCCLRGDIYVLAAVPPISMKFCMMVELYPGRVLVANGDIHRCLQMWGRERALGGPFWLFRH